MIQQVCALIGKAAGWGQTRARRSPARFWPVLYVDTKDSKMQHYSRVHWPVKPYIARILKSLNDLLMLDIDQALLADREVFVLDKELIAEATILKALSFRQTT